MRKNLIAVLVILIFAGAVLFVSLERLTVRARPSLAVSTLKFEVLPETTPTATPGPKVEYYLVYPGILPDHPFYKLKALRDRIWLWLASDSLKKAELLLLFSDKRVGAGKVLIEGNKVDLGVSTFWKGEKYLDSAVKELKKAKSKNLNAGLLAGKIKNAALKHEEILLGFKEKMTPEGKVAIEEILKYLKEIQKETGSL